MNRQQKRAALKKLRKNTRKRKEQANSRPNVLKECADILEGITGNKLTWNAKSIITNIIRAYSLPDNIVMITTIGELIDMFENALKQEEFKDIDVYTKLDMFASVFEGYFKAGNLMKDYQSNLILKGEIIVLLKEQPGYYKLLDNEVNALSEFILINGPIISSQAC